jgi:hypothetical protein
MTTKKTIAVWTAKDSSRQKSALPTPTEALKTVAQVDPEILANNLTDYLQLFDGVLVDRFPKKSGFQVEEIEIGLVVNAHGGVELIGKIDVGAEASIKVTLKRSDASLG